MSIDVRKTLIVDVGDKSYTLTELNASLAYRYLNKIRKVQEGIELSAEDVKELITESTGIHRDKYEREFSGKMMNLFKLIEEIVEFNYSDVFQKDASDEEVQE